MSRLGKVRRKGGIDELEECLFGSEDLCVDLFQEGVVSDKVFGEGSNSICKVRNGGKYVDRLFMTVVTSNQLSAAQGATQAGVGSGWIGTSLTNWLSSAAGRRSSIGLRRFSGLHAAKSNITTEGTFFWEQLKREVVNGV